MEELISDIVVKLNNGDFHNESEISRGVVLQLLNKLGWNTFDTNIVRSEYSVGNGRVDFALARKKGVSPSVFIEVKQPGKIDHADEQLFNYAYREGVPFIILTDGKTWNFYLPAGQGNYESRRIYKLDLTERSPSESASKLRRYLDFERVKNEDALEDAQKDYKSKYKANEAKSTIPDAWKELVDEENEYLYEIINNAVEKKCGYKAKLSDISDFLSKIRFTSDTTPTFEKPKKTVLLQPPPNNHQYGSWYSINGKRYSVSSAKKVVVELLNALYDIDNSLFEKCLKKEDNYGRNRQYIARRKEDLYKDRPDLVEKNAKLKGGFYLLTNFSNSIKVKILDMAFDIVGLKKGKEIDYNL